MERAKALAASSQDNHYHHNEPKVPAMSYHVPIVYHGPPAPLAPDGQVIDTPEVAKARDAHLYAYHHAKTLVGNDEYSKYDGKNRE